MKKAIATIFIFGLLAQIFAQNQPKYSRATIFFDGKNPEELARLGLETDHGIYSPGISVTNDFSEKELSAASAAGFRTTIEIDDVTEFYINQNKNPSAKPRGLGQCPDFDALWPTPANWAHGSMGGYFTLAEMEQMLDAMRAKFPNLISARKPCSPTIDTWEGRKLQFVRISDNPEADEAEPEVLYTALHHAREPLGMSQMLMFMWHVLENYATDPEMKALVDNAEMYFVPCVNPDGYVFNQTNNPNGGGFWRKNRRVNGGSVFGVDLNRNYGHQWGFDNIGSQPDSTSDVYRGPAAFSEPETRTVRDFCAAHDFKLALNYHTWGNLLIHPWGWADMATQDSAKFRRITRWLTRESRFNPGLASQTVGYQVNGTSDDWQYANEGIFALTPEVGRINGFWPPEDEIDELSKSNIWANLTLARFALNAAFYEDKTDSYLPNILSGKLDFDLHFLGLEPTGFTVSVSPFSANVLATGGAQTFNFNQNDQETGHFSYELSQTIQPGDVLKFNITVTNNALFSHQFVLEKTYGGKKSTPLNDPGTDLGNWDGGLSWGLNTTDFVSPPTSIGDSPDADYIEDQYNFMSSTAPVLIPADAVSAKLRFWAKWEAEARFDFAEVYANGVPLCGKYTNFGSQWQHFSEPIYDGIQPEWVEESMDLSAFLGQDVLFSILMNSDGGDNHDGFNFDDLRVEIIEKNNSVNVVNLENGAFKTWSQPNPARLSTTLVWEKNLNGVGRNLLIFNQLGQVLKKYDLPDTAHGQFELDLADWKPGVYFWKMTDGQTTSQPQRLVIAR